MHSSRMRAVRSSSRLTGTGVCLPWRSARARKCVPGGVADPEFDRISLPGGANIRLGQIFPKTA